MGWGGGVRGGEETGVKHTQERQEGYRTKGLKVGRSDWRKHCLKIPGRRANGKEGPSQSHKAACPEALPSFPNQEERKEAAGRAAFCEWGSREGYCRCTHRPESTFGGQLFPVCSFSTGGPTVRTVSVAANTSAWKVEG